MLSRASVGLPFLTALAVIAFGVTAVFVVSPGIDGFEKARLGEMVSGDAHKPFVYRQLLPLLVRGTVSILPAGSNDLLISAVAKIPPLRNKLDDSDIGPALYLQFITAFFYMWLFLTGFGLSFKYLAAAFYSAPDYLEKGSSLLAVLLLPAFFDKASYLYDFPALMLFTLGLALLARRKFAGFLTVFILGCINKETIILLTMIYFLHHLKSSSISRFRFYLLLAIQLVVFLAVKLVLFIVFKNNPGGFVIFHLFDYNLQTIGRMGIETAAALLIIAVAVFHGWKDKPALLKDALWIAVPLFVLTFFFGYIDEQRDFYELYPVLMLLILPSLCQILKLKIDFPRRRI